MPPFHPLDYLTLANNIVASGKSEPILRTAIGRGYYALFLIARDRLGITETFQIHKKVRRKLKRRKGHKATGQKLESLFRLRCVADYQIVPNDPSFRDWDNNWDRAQKIIADILPKIQGI